MAKDYIFALISGPCVIESREHTLRMAEAIRDICGERNIPFVFKASFDKANRTSLSGFRGPGLEEGLAILGRIRREFSVPVVTDIHSPEQAAVADRGYPSPSERPTRDSARRCAQCGGIRRTGPVTITPS